MAIVAAVTEVNLCILYPCILSQETQRRKVVSVESFPPSLCCRQAGRQGTLVTAQWANRWDLPFPLLCLLSRSLPSYTHTHTPPHININTHHLSPLERSISRDHTASSVSQALLTRCADVDRSFTQPDSWPSIITRVRGPATPLCSRTGGQRSPKTANTLMGDSFCSLRFFLEAKCQTLKHVSTVEAHYWISE